MEIGKAVKESGIPREEIWITTKLWPSEYGEGKTAEAIDKALARLGTDYIDLLLLAGRASILRGVILIGIGIEIFITGIIGGRNQNDAPSMSDRVFLILSLTEGAFQI